MKSVIAILAFVALCFAEVDYLNEFSKWMVKYDKYYTANEFQHRLENFQRMYDYVANFDNNAHTFTVALNEFSDLSGEEFSAMYKGLAFEYEERRDFVPAHFPDVPAEVDWRKKGAVTHVKNQGQCGSCWSFSTTGSIEGAHQIATGNLVSFSEQQLVDCSRSYGNNGCGGGLMDNAFKYVIATKGLDTESSYPYTARNGQCHYNPANSGGTITGYHDIPSKSETALTAAAVNTPISVAIDASHSSFQAYHSGVYYEPNCSETQLDHGVLVVGYGTEGQSDYYIVKNSWGASWGLKGYIWMSRNRNNNCGIATLASYPTGASF